ncbi:MAG TPA: tyrosine--tRNA ligase [Candidatus Nanoarchaeia archaeon]|nr:tyrosine--tRNA ligase [uncultured archaeon]
MEQTSNLLTRNVASVYPSKEAFVKRLKAKKPLKIYLGIDPSSPKIHLGNAIALWKLEEFQKLGHKIILLIGDFTGMIGDPTDKTATRPPLTREQVLENSKTYRYQASKILNFSGKNRAEVKYNSTWLAKLNFGDLVKLAANFTIQRFIERDMFQKRLSEKKPISLHEFLYPLMQGYDSVAMGVDAEIGGTDQTFNMLIGRELMQKVSGKEKFVLTLPLLEGTDGRKMSKSFNNSIDIDEPANEMFGKIMSLKDELIVKYFEFCTREDEARLKEIKQRLKEENPINLKKELAKNIVTLYHGSEQAKKAQEEFERVVQNKELPALLEEIEVSRTSLKKPVTYASVSASCGLVSSISEAVRLAQQGGLVFDEQKIRNARDPFDVEGKNEVTIQAGKRRWKKVKFVK